MAWRIRLTKEQLKDRESLRSTRFEVWREEPNVRERPYRRKDDRRTITAYHHVKTWADVFPLIKRGQRLFIRTYVGQPRYGALGVRHIAVKIMNRVGKPKVVARARIVGKHK